MLSEDHTSAEKASFEHSGTEFRLYVDGTRQSLEHSYVDVGHQFERRWTIDFPDGMTGDPVDILGQWWSEGSLEIEIEIQVDFE